MAEPATIILTDEGRVVDGVLERWEDRVEATASKEGFSVEEADDAVEKDDANEEDEATSAGESSPDNDTSGSEDDNDEEMTFFRAAPAPEEAAFFPHSTSDASNHAIGQPRRATVVVTKPSKNAKLGLFLQKNTEPVRITSISSDGLFAGSNLEEGMVLESVNGKAVVSYKGCLKLLKEAEGRVTVVAAAKEYCACGNGRPIVSDGVCWICWTRSTSTSTAPVTVVTGTKAGVDVDDERTAPIGAELKMVFGTNDANEKEDCVTEEDEAIADESLASNDAPSGSTSGSDDDDGKEMWELKKVMGTKDLAKTKPTMCMTDECGLVACLDYRSNRAPEEPWYSCLDCQENDFGGWPKKKDEVPLKTVPDDLREAMVDKCTRLTAPAMPDLDVEDDSDDDDSDDDDYQPPTKKAKRTSNKRRSPAGKKRRNKRKNVKRKLKRKRKDTRENDKSSTAEPHHFKMYAPLDWESDKYDPLDQELHRGRLTFIAEMKAKNVLNKDGNEPDWNLPYIPWHPKSDGVRVAFAYHYQTTESSRGLKDLHTAMARRSDGTVREHTWECGRQAIGPEEYEDMILLDMFCFSFPAWTSPFAELSSENLLISQEAYTVNILQVLHNNPRVVIGLCSDATVCLYGKYVLGGDEDSVAEYHEANPDKLISGSQNGLEVGAHPSSMYKKLFQSNMESKCNRSDRFFTAARRVITGNIDAEECRYFRGIFDKNSSFFRLADLAHRDGCRLGGKITGTMRSDAGKLRRARRYDEIDDMGWFLLESSSRGGTTSSEMKTHAWALIDAGRSEDVSDKQWNLLNTGRFTTEQRSRGGSSSSDLAVSTKRKNLRNDEAKNAAKKIAAGKKDDLTPDEAHAIELKRKAGRIRMMKRQTNVGDTLIVTLKCCRSAEGAQCNGTCETSLESMRPRGKASQVSGKKCLGSVCNGKPKSGHRDWDTDPLQVSAILNCCRKANGKVSYKNAKKARDMLQKFDMTCFCARCKKACEYWNLEKVFSAEELEKDWPAMCMTEGCDLVACCKWEGKHADGETKVVWHTCLDCQEKDGGWPEGTESDTLPIKFLSEANCEAIIAKCSKQKSPVMPRLPTSAPN